MKEKETNNNKSECDIHFVDDHFEIIDDAEIDLAKPKNLDVFDKALEEAISKLEEFKDISSKDLSEITYEIRHLGTYSFRPEMLTF